MSTKMPLAIEVNQERLIALFLELIQIDSPSGAERAIADVLKKKLEERGFQVREDDAAAKLAQESPEKRLPKGTAGNLIATLKGTTEAPHLLFMAHMDTVVSNRGVRPIREQGVIKTDEKTILGADDKAGVAGILEAFSVVKEKNLPHGDVTVVFSICEELGLYGAKYLDVDSLRVDFGYVLDSGGPPEKVIGAAPYEVDYRVTVHGRAAHSGVNPEDGINALAAACSAVSQFKQGRIDKHSTRNIGIFRAGETTNTVCDRAHLEGEARSLDKKQVDALVSEVRQAFEHVCPTFHATFDMDVEEAYSGFRLTENDVVVRHAFKALKQIGLTPVLAERGGGSDTNILNGRGIPAVNLGVGASRDHTVYESVHEAHLIAAAQMVCSILASVLDEK